MRLPASSSVYIQDPSISCPFPGRGRSVDRLRRRPSRVRDMVDFLARWRTHFLVTNGEIPQVLKFTGAAAVAPGLWRSADLSLQDWHPANNPTSGSRSRHAILHPITDPPGIKGKCELKRKGAGKGQRALQTLAANNTCAGGGQHGGPSSAASETAEAWNLPVALHYCGRFRQRSSGTGMLGNARHLRS